MLSVLNNAGDVLFKSVLPFLTNESISIFDGKNQMNVNLSVGVGHNEGLFNKLCQGKE